MDLISRTPYRGARGDIPIVCPVKNEIGLVGHFITHHRAIGVENFIFIDNGSTDGTTEFLLSEPGCTVYRTTESFVDANFGMVWITEVLRNSAHGQWAAYLDCDELLVFENMETQSLTSFVREYCTGDIDTTFAVMIDMYPASDWSSISARTASSIAETLNCFDKDYIVRQRPDRPGRTRRPDAIEILGGPRCRLFSTLERDASHDWPYYMLAGQVDRFIDKVPIGLMPALARVWPRGMQALFKSPLNLIGDDFRYGYSHESSNHRKAGYLLGILHLKFCDELNARFDPQFSYDNHYRHGLERFQLAGALARHGSRPLTYSGTRKYTGSQSLAEQNLIGERPAAVWRDGLPAFRTGV